MRNLPCALACSNCRTLLETAAADASPALCFVHSAYEGAPLNAPSTSVSVTRPLSGPERSWVSLKIAPPNVPCWVLPLFPVDVISSSEPWRASIWEPEGIWSRPVSGTNLPLILISTKPLTGVMLNVLPTVGALGAGAASVVNVTSGPNVVPSLLVATSRT